MKNLVLTLLIVSATITSLYSQQSYIVTLIGDTLNGSVKIHEKFRTAEIITFSHDGNETDYTSYQLRGF